MKPWARTSFFALTLFVASFSYSADANPLIQTRVNELLDRAETSLVNGSYEEAMACTEAVLLKPILTVSVDTAGLPTLQRDQAEEVISEALSSWEENLNYEVTFIRGEASDADIKIGFRDTVYHLGRSVAGVATWSRQVYNWGNRFTSRVAAEIKIRTLDDGGELVSHDAMLQSSMHEVGHVLGLWDSARVGDLMGPLQRSRPVTKPTDHELESLMFIRNRAIHVMQGCLTAMKRSR